ncbi:MAG: hypothetical protein AAF761_06150 [Pseudomonadota bacterium]
MAYFRIIGAVSALAALTALAGCGVGASLGNSANSSAGSAGSAASSGSAGSAGSFGLARRQNTVVEQQIDVRTVAAGNRTLVSRVKQARFQRTRDGGIIHATALPPRTGYYDAVLFSPTGLVPDETGTVVLELRAKEPLFATATGTERTREIEVGIFMSNQELARARQIVVVANGNAIRLRR